MVTWPDREEYTARAGGSSLEDTEVVPRALGSDWLGVVVGVGGIGHKVAREIRVGTVADGTTYWELSSRLLDDVYQEMHCS